MGLLKLYINDESYKYQIELKDQKSYISIFYKNMKVLWVLEEFNNNEAYNISKQILPYTKNTKYNGICRAFICQSKKDLKIIYDILLSTYMKKQSKIANINLAELSISQFL